MKTDFEKYGDDCMEVSKTYTDSLDERKLSLIWKSIENSPERTGKVWLEDILDQTYKERNPDTKYIYD